MSSPNIPALQTRCRSCYQIVPARKIATAVLLSVHTEEHTEARCEGSNTMQPMTAAKTEAA